MYIKFEWGTFIIKALCYVTVPILNLVAGICAIFTWNPMAVIVGICFLGFAILEPILAHDWLIKYINKVQTMNVGENK